MKAAFLDALQRDVAARWSKAGQTDAYSEYLSDLLGIAVKAYGLGSRELVTTILQSDDYYPQSELGYALADEGAAVLPEVEAATQDPHPANRSNAVGVLAGRVAEQRRGRSRHPLSPREQAAIIAAVGRAAESADPFDASNGVWGLSEIRDPAAAPILERLVREHPTPKYAGLGAMAARALFAIRFCRGDPPETAGQLSVNLAQLRNADWRIRAAALCSITLGGSDPYYGPSIWLVLGHFPSQASEISADLIRMLAEEDRRIRSSSDLRADILYRQFFEFSTVAVAGLKRTEAADALIGALGYYDPGALDGLAVLPLQAAPKLLARLAAASPNERTGLLQVLTQIVAAARGKHESDPGLEAAVAAAMVRELDDPLPANRSYALAGIGALRYSAVQDRVNQMRLHDPDAGVRKRADEVLREIFQPGQP